jgi:uncharacterized protein (TIGR00251 family)
LSLELRDTANGVSLRVRVQPRASKSAIAGERGGALLVRVTAPPVAGEANEAVVRLLARALGVPASGVRIQRGRSSREKHVLIGGATRERVAALAELG